MKITCSRARQLEIAASLYGPLKGSRATYCLEKNSRSKIKGIGSSSQVIRRGAVSSFHSYYLCDKYGAEQDGVGQSRVELLRNGWGLTTK